MAGVIAAEAAAAGRRSGVQPVSPSPARWAVTLILLGALAIVIAFVALRH